MEKFCSDCHFYEVGISSTEVGFCHAWMDLLSVDTPIFAVTVYGGIPLKKCEFFKEAGNLEEISA